MSCVLSLSVQHVADDYAQRLDRSRVKVEALVSSALSRLAFGGNGGQQQQGRMGLEDGERDEDAGLPQLRQCRLANVSTCDVTMEVCVYDCCTAGLSVNGEIAVLIFAGGRIIFYLCGRSHEKMNAGTYMMSE